jgi:hypothetical protein
MQGVTDIPISLAQHLKTKFKKRKGRLANCEQMENKPEQ